MKENQTASNQGNYIECYEYDCTEDDVCECLTIEQTITGIRLDDGGTLMGISILGMELSPHYA